jgi:hypothetical protein
MKVERKELIKFFVSFFLCALSFSSKHNAEGAEKIAIKFSWWKIH